MSATEPITAGEVLLACVKHWDIRKDHLIPRCCLTGWEADLLIIRRSGWAEEVEIKVSKADFRAEWKSKAHKHEDLRLGGCRMIGSLRGYTDLSEVAPNDPRRVERHGYLFLRDQLTLIRKFWFAMPKSLAEAVLEEVPAEYGVLAVDGWGRRVLREATILKPARKLTDAERIHALHSAYYRWWQDTLRLGGSLEHLISCPDLAFHGREEERLICGGPSVFAAQMNLPPPPTPTRQPELALEAVE